MARFLPVHSQSKQGRAGAETMIAGLNASELLELALLLGGVGGVSGFLAGVFGVGGGAILVPVFYECFRLAGVPLEVRMPLCIGTSLAIIIPTSIRSYRAHRARGAGDMGVIEAFGVFVGLLSTLMGIGGGLFANLLMTFYGRPIHQAVATSSALAVLISIPGAIGYVYAGWPAAARFPEVAALQWPFALGYVSLIGAVLVMPTSLLTAPLGVKVAHAMSKRTLEIAFGSYLFIVGGRFVISLLSAGA